MKLIERLSGSALAQAALTLLGYALYAAVLGASLVPAVSIGVLAFRRLAAPATGLGGIALFCLAAAGCLYLFFFVGLLLIGLLVRAFALGVKPGRHRTGSLVTLWWLLAGGISTWAYRLILPFVPMTFISQTFYRLAGCRIGRNVFINSLELNDPFLVSIGDNTVIGGGAVITPHVFEAGRLILEPVTIGRDCLIGAEAYLSPGVEIGDGSVIGLRAFIRKGTRVPAGSRIFGLAGLPARRAHRRTQTR